MNMALVETDPSVPVVTADQLALIKTTVAAGATDAELKLYLYDCARRHVHPLDRLLYFTKRGGRYTPVTSIDFMRSQAAMSGEMAGSDDPKFEAGAVGGPPFAATATVYRMTGNQRFAYTATARWSEYCPDNAPMWKRMPHTMLGKCAEALALRKAFPQQLAGLYASEELDQAGGPKGYTVEPSALGTPPQQVLTPAVPAAADGGESAASSDDGPDLHVDADPDALYITRVEVRDTNNKNVKKHLIWLSDGRDVSTINPKLGALAEQLCQDRVPVAVVTKDTKWGIDLTALSRAEEVVL